MENNTVEREPEIVWALEYFTRVLLLPTNDEKVANTDWARRMAAALLEARAVEAEWIQNRFKVTFDANEARIFRLLDDRAAKIRRMAQEVRDGK